MQCELLFYMARKTGESERTLEKKLKQTELKITKTLVATGPLDLAEQLSDALKRSNLMILIGGLSKGENINIVDILSKTLESRSKNKITCKRIENLKGSNDGFIVHSGMQMIVMLPDEPKDINVMMGYVLLKYISDFYKLNLKLKREKKEKVKFTHVDNAEDFLSKVVKVTSPDYDDEKEQTLRFPLF